MVCDYSAENASGKREYDMKLKRICAVLLLIAIVASTPALASQAQVNKLLSIAKKNVGKPYKLSSHAPSSFNCLSFVMYCYNKVQGGTISKNGIRKAYKRVGSIGSLKPGDLVRFKIGNNKTFKMLNYHYGIYTGKGYFVSASRTAGRVIVSKVRSYNGRFLGGYRIF